MSSPICSVCAGKPDQLLTLTDTKTVITACIHRAPELIVRNHLIHFEPIDLKAVKAVLKYWKLRESQQPRAIRYYF